MAHSFLVFCSVAILMHVCHGMTIVAKNVSQYQDADIYCNPSTDCNVICNASKSCQRATIHCNLSTECNVHCIVTEACDRAIIYWPDDSPYQLICNASYDACYSMTYTPYYDGTNPITFDCIGLDTCYYMIFHCPESATCNLNCLGEYTCYGIKVHIPSSSFH
eukprot:68533_1